MKNKILIALPLLAVVLMATSCPVQIHRVDWDPDTATYLEIHGTGFAPHLGDNVVHINHDIRLSPVMISSTESRLDVVPLPGEPIEDEIFVQVCVPNVGCDEGTFDLTWGSGE